MGHLSIGIDVGTTTFHYVVNRLYLEKRPGRGGFPRLQLAGYEPVHESPIFLTPYREAGTELDGAAILNRLELDLAACGLAPADMATGAVIVTGQAAKRNNAERIIASLSALFPQMVSTIAGSRLESLLAARGARVDRYSRDSLQKVMNIDIGGGTTNIALFDNGRTIGSASLWLGGRMVRTNQRGCILHMTPAARSTAAAAGLRLPQGAASRAELERLADAAARFLFDFIAGRPVPPELVDFNALPSPVGELDAVSFTGGVAEIMRSANRADMDWLRFNDLGVLLAERTAARSTAHRLYQPDIAGIRATALGVGIHHMQIAGSTIHLSDPSILPLINVPVVRLALTKDGPQEIQRQLAESAALLPADAPPAYCIEAAAAVGYQQLTHLARALVDRLQSTSHGLLITVFEADLGKVFGYMVESLRRHKPDLQIISIDGVTLDDNTTLDIGAPVAEGALPVCAKTLYF